MLVFYLGMIDGKEEKSIFEQVYVENLNFFLNYANKFLADRTKAQEAVHEAFVYLLENSESYFRPNKEEMKKLTTTIIKGKAIDILRRENKFIKIDLADLENYLPAPGPSLDKRLIEGEKIEDLAQALKYIDPEAKQILLMKYLEKMSYKEISKILNIEVRTAQTKAFRAKKKLRKILEAGEEENE